LKKGGGSAGHAGAIPSTPDNHFHAGPNRRVVRSRSRRIYDTRGCPTVRVGIVPSTGVQDRDKAVKAAPDDHFAASPHCGVTEATSGHVRDARGCPGIISASRLI